MRTHWKKIVVGVVIAAIVGVTAGPWVYIHWIKDPPKSRLTINDAPPITAATGGSVSTDPAAPTGTGPASASPNAWKIASGSQVGYRVVEVLFGQHTEGVGRTGNVTGSITLDGATVSAATFTVDMTSLKSDDGRRDHRFTGEIMNTATIPTATFTLTKPIALGAVPADGKAITASATGDMLLHGVTKSVTFDVTAKKTGNSIAVSGSFDVKFADYNINNPSANFVTTQDHGLIEFALAFAKG